jgi:hypothetical protein
MAKTMKAQPKRGRPKLNDLRLPVTIYVPQSVIDHYGNKTVLKEHLHSTIINTLKSQTNEIPYYVPNSVYRIN